MSAPALLYHLISADDLRGVQDEAYHAPESLALEGFIHCSRRDQVIAVANRFYPARDDLFVLVIDPVLLTAELRYEAPAHPDGSPPDTSDLFPHIYGRLNMNAVIGIHALTPTPTGYASPDSW